MRNINDFLPKPAHIAVEERIRASMKAARKTYWRTVRHCLLHDPKLAVAMLVNIPAARICDWAVALRERRAEEAFERGFKESIKVAHAKTRKTAGASRQA